MLQIVRYGIVGVGSNLLAYSSYLLLTCLGIEPKRAMTTVYIVAALVGFFGNRKWTFSHKGSQAQAAIRYASAHLFGYLMNLTVLKVFVDYLGYAHQLVQAIAIVFVAGMLFMIFKYFVFHDDRTHSRRL
jgi:putative flippase GtrA